MCVLFITNIEIGNISQLFIRVCDVAMARVDSSGHRRVATIKTGISVACTCEMRAPRSIRALHSGGGESIQLRSLEYNSRSIDIFRSDFYYKQYNN